MPPKTKSDTAMFLLGQPDSVLHPEFLEGVQKDGLQTSVLPLKRTQAASYHWANSEVILYVRDHFGKKNSNISQSDVEKCVADHILKYWMVAGFQTLALFRVEKHIKVEVEKYKNINKAKARNSKTENKRVEYLGRIKKLFDISTPDLETIL